MPPMNFPYSQNLFPAICLLILFVFLYHSLFNGNQDIPISNLSFSSNSHTMRPSSFAVNRLLTTSVYKSRSRHNTTYIKKKSSLERIEDDLAQARAAIRKAIRSQSYTSDEEETFIPRGNVYRIHYAFHQSHIEMVKRFKLWTYREGDQPLACHPDEAHAFFLPFSVANVICYVYEPILFIGDYSRERLQRFAGDCVGVVADRYRYCNRSGGTNQFHGLFILILHGPDISSANHELFKNFNRVLCNANTSEGFRPKIDVSMAEAYLTRGELGPPRLGLDPSNCTILAFFAGGVHGFIRELLLEHWKEKDDDIQVHDKFCLCPSGYEVASPRIVESIYVGSIPVIIKDDYWLPFSDIPVQKTKDIKMILQAILCKKYVKLHERVVKVARHFELHRLAKPFNVIPMVLHSVWLRRLNLKLE
ncbi:hypothetical protein ACJRO7_014389 [Eucalyptus globulus]|uniref:Exostosin GT47 domain-containing protein n=1 Tax=Eucalyptus globulus TaxID=34317 RepID=A0ABD3L0X2_EUCGL